MKKIILLLFSLFLLQTCNSQDKNDIKINAENKKVDKFDLNTLIFKENINSIIKELNLNKNNAVKKENGLRFGEDKLFREKEISSLSSFSIIQLICPNNLYLENIPLNNDQLTFHFRKKNDIIGLIELEIQKNEQGEKIKDLLTKKFGAPSADPLNKDLYMVWNKKNGKTYILEKIFSDNNENLGYHLIIADSNFKDSIEGSFLYLAAHRSFFYPEISDLIIGKDDWQEELFK